MDISTAQWLSEMVGLVGMEEPALVHQCQMNSLNDSVHEFFSLSSETYSNYPSFRLQNTPTQTSQITATEKPAAKQIKTHDWNSDKNDKFTPPNQKAFSSPSSSKIISFANSNTAPDSSKHLYGNLNCTVKSKDEVVSNTNMKFSFMLSESSYENPLEFGKEETERVCTTTTRTPLQAKDHVLAERKRRERMSQRFMALSALLPGLKKLDKASVLGDAIKYIKQLQEHVKKLEEEARKNPVESIVCVRKSWISGEDNFDMSSTQLFPEIGVRVSENNVIVRIQCEKHNRFIAKIFNEMERLHLLVINSSVIPFGHATIAINIIAQMDSQFSIIASDLAKSLRSAIQDVFLSPPE